MRKILTIVFALVFIHFLISCDKENYSVDMSLLQGCWELVKPQDESPVRTLTFDGNKCVASFDGSSEECGYNIDGHKIILLRNMIGVGFYYRVDRLDSEYLVFDSMQAVIMPNKEDYCEGTYTYRRIE